MNASAKALPESNKKAKKNTKNSVVINGAVVDFILIKVEKKLQKCRKNVEKNFRIYEGALLFL